MILFVQAVSVAVAEAADEVVSAVTVVEEEDSVEEADLEGTEEEGYFGW